ncbi:MAG: hypothetical protein QM703_08400 [Gemmatales bacterium]
MSTTMHSGMNGRLKKSLSHQLDRLDTILDGLADALNGAVANAVRESVGEAAREAVKVALAEALLQAAAENTPPSAKPGMGFFAQARTAAKNAFKRIQNLFGNVFQKVKQFCTRHTGATVLAAQSAFATVRSRSMRIGMLLGVVSTCIVGLFRKESQRLWWGAGIVLSTMLLESYFGTLGTLLMGGGVIYLMTRTQAMNSLHPTIQQQAA